MSKLNYIFAQNGQVEKVGVLLQVLSDCLEQNISYRINNELGKYEFCSMYPLTQEEKNISKRIINGFIRRNGNYE